ncbi:MAG: hypothetical protein HRT35_08675 [Algicola sp.]|nr:hypothetical protein [Algicola sp.]
MKKKLLLLVCFALHFPAYSDGNCNDAIKSANLEQASEHCIWSTSGDLNKDLIFGTAGHKFGSRLLPSRSALLVKKLAMENNADFQYFWGFILSNLYQSQGKKYRVTERAQTNMWLTKAANGGNFNAISYYINMHLNEAIEASAPQVKEDAIVYARYLVETKMPGAENLLKKVLAKPTVENTTADFYKRVEQYETLPKEQIKKMAKALRNGHTKSNQKAMIGTRFKPDIIKSTELYEYLVVKHNDTEAGFILAKIFLKTQFEKALTLMRWSAERDHGEAAGWLGDYLFCTGKKDEGMVWLKKAQKLGYEYAEDSIGEIEDLGSPTTCEESWRQ